MRGEICSLCLGMAKTDHHRVHIPQTSWQIRRYYFHVLLSGKASVDGCVCDRECSVRAGHSMLKSSPVYLHHVGLVSSFLQWYYFFFFVWSSLFSEQSYLFSAHLLHIRVAFDSILPFQDKVPQCTKKYYYNQIDLINYLYVTQSRRIIEFAFRLTVKLPHTFTCGGHLVYCNLWKEA